MAAYPGWGSPVAFSSPRFPFNSIKQAKEVNYSLSPQRLRAWAKDGVV